jgi:hypothetical protein
MPLENWIQHSRVDEFLYDWQTLIAGGAALVAAWLTISATIWSANREIKSSREQIETTLRLERRRVASEGYARVLLEASEARSKFLSADAKERDAKERTITSKQAYEARTSRGAYEARQRFSKGAFPELRSACVRYGGRITRDLLELESDIDKFASQWMARNEIPVGQHAGFKDQLDRIVDEAVHLRDEAVAEMERATIVIAETEPEPPAPTPKRPWRRRLTGA